MHFIFCIYVFIVNGSYYRLNKGEMMAFQTQYILQNQERDQDIFVQYENYVIVRDQILDMFDAIFVCEGLDNQMMEQKIYILVRQPKYKIQQLITNNPLSIEIITIVELPFIKGLEFYSFIFSDDDTLLIDCRFTLVSKNCFYEYKLSSKILKLRQLNFNPVQKSHFRQIIISREYDLVLRIEDEFIEAYDFANLRQQNITQQLGPRFISSIGIENYIFYQSKSELYNLNLAGDIQFVKLNQLGQVVQIRDSFIYFCETTTYQICDKLHEINTEQFLFIEIWQSYILICNHETVYVYNGKYLIMKEIIINLKKVLVIKFYNEIYVFAQNFIRIYQLQNRNLLVIQAKQDNYIIEKSKYKLSYNTTNKNNKKIIQIQKQFIRQDIISNFWFMPAQNFLGGDIQYSFRLLNQDNQKLFVFKQRILQELFQLDCEFLQIMKLDYYTVVNFICQKQNQSLYFYESTSQTLNHSYSKSQITFPYKLKQHRDFVTYDNFTFYIFHDKKSFINQTQIIICEGYLQFYNQQYAVCLYPDKVKFIENNGFLQQEVQFGIQVKFQFFIENLSFITYHISHIKVQKFAFSSRSYIVNKIFVDNYISSIIFENYLVIITRDRISRYYFITPYRLQYSAEFLLFGRVIENNATIISDNYDFFIQQNGQVLVFNILKSYFIQQFALGYPIISACDGLIYYKNNRVIQSIRYEPQFIVETIHQNWLVYSFQFEVCATNKYDKECLIQNQTVYQSYNSLQPKENIQLYYKDGQKEIDIEQLRFIGSFVNVLIKNNSNIQIKNNLDPISNITRQTQIQSLFYEQNLLYVAYFDKLEVINIFTQNEISISLNLERLKNIQRYDKYILLYCFQLFYFIQCLEECYVIYQIKLRNPSLKYRIFEKFVIGYDNKQYSLFEIDFLQLMLIEKKKVDIFNNLIDFYFKEELIVAYVDFNQKIHIQQGSQIQEYFLSEIYSGINLEESLQAMLKIKIISIDNILIFTKYQGNLIFQFNLNGAYRLISLLAIYPNLTIKSDWIFVNNEIITVISITQNNNLLIYQFNQQEQQKVIDCNLVEIRGIIWIQSVYFFIENGRSIISLKSDLGIYNFYYDHKIKLVAQNYFQDEIINLELINPQSTQEIQLKLKQEFENSYLNVLYVILLVLFMLIVTFVIKRSFLLRKYYQAYE